MSDHQNGTPPVASSRQGRTVTADEAREAWRSIVDDAEILNETPRHKDTSIILAYIDQSEVEVASLREALEKAIPFIGYQAHVPDILKRCEDLVYGKEDTTDE